MSMLMRRRKSGDTTITLALKYSSDLTWRIFFGLKMKIEFFFSRYSCRLSDTLVSPSVPTPMTKASMRHGNPENFHTVVAAGREALPHQALAVVPGHFDELRQRE